MMNDYLTNKFDPIQKIEILLRNIVSEVLSANVGPNWLADKDHGLGKKKVQELKKLMNEEKSRRYTNLVDQDLISYTEFSELKNILIKPKNKKFFLKIFRDWEAFNVYLKKTEYLRNPAKHHRILYPHENSLLKGIAGEIEHNINTWHIGESLTVKKYRFSFFEYVETKNRTDKDILDEVKEIGKNWIEMIKKYFLTEGIKEESIRILRYDFDGEISAEHIKANWHSSSTPNSNSNINGVDCKSIFLQLWYSPSSRLELNNLMEFIDKKYAIYAFELDGRIDIKKLKETAKNIAGLNPSSSGNNKSVEYGITYFTRIGSKNINDKTGEFFIQNDHNNFRNAHDLISHGTILSYLTGNMPRRLIISLIKSSI
ncbi:MAG: hypothetical protein ACTSVX_02450 [Promethearchaeota archaeon]